MSKWTIIFLLEVIAMTILNLLASGTTGLLIVPFLAAFGGWQMGVLTAREEMKR